MLKNYNTLFKPILNYIKSLVVLKLLLSLHHNNKQIGIMNFGTPQEMYDEENEINPQTKEEKNFSCLISIIYILIVFLIAYFIW